MHILMSMAAHLVPLGGFTTNPLSVLFNSGPGVRGVLEDPPPFPPHFSNRKENHPCLNYPAKKTDDLDITKKTFFLR